MYDVHHDGINCECADMSYRSQMFCFILCFRGLGKVAIVGGALYVTVDQGIWSESKQASNALDRITTKVMLTDDYLKQVNVKKAY